MDWTPKTDRTFDELLDRAGLSKAELARRLGMKPNTISKWKDEPPPYAVAYLKLWVEYQRVRP